ncbi:type II toxin-antitoxin system YafO family toxin [Gallibacterium anatis]|uniref:type II toxin-antitoxin system YafO family toxin n=1 Tax=Gallibacterium anatis TaxID=750 RepID=UPI0030065C0D
MPRVTIEPTLIDFPDIGTIAAGIALFKASGENYYPPFLGHHGGFERNIRAEENEIKKFHIALSRKDFLLETWRFTDGNRRTCDNFLVYVHHWYHSEYYQILDIISPNAHTRVDRLIYDIVKKSDVFHALSLSDLQKLPYFDENYVL